jgi:hypothetical protein
LGDAGILGPAGDGDGGGEQQLGDGADWSHGHPSR